MADVQTETSGDANTAVVPLPHRDPGDLTKIEKELLQAFFKRKYPDKHIVFRRTDPKDAAEHLEHCLKLEPLGVFLSKTQEYPTGAIKEGFVHVSIVLGLHNICKVDRLHNPDFAEHNPPLEEKRSYRTPATTALRRG